ncbi:hypothetical protein HYC85_016081 [Camellia sinensis]|uniref:Myb-related protein 123 n=1 Tax=Camellia sinensis TaxID=4442 RepID=A0A7J7GYJ9_CAMSI|nr:hypothetical protein HYC85_016081 [Camellia sinensis]
MEMKEGKSSIKKGLWKPEEDIILKNYVEAHGEGNWANVSEKSGLMRGGKSCRMRWKNYLRPNIKRGRMSDDEKDLIIRLHKLLGNRWSLIAGRLPGRTDNEVKNYWNTHLNKRSSQTKTTTICSKNKKKLQQFPTSQPTRCKISENDDKRSQGRKREDITAVSPWIEHARSFNFDTEPPLFPANDALLFTDDEPFMPILDSLALYEALQSNGGEEYPQEVAGHATGLC